VSVAVLTLPASRARRWCAAMAHLGHPCEPFTQLQPLLDALEDRRWQLVVLHGLPGPAFLTLEAIRRVRAVGGPSLPVMVAADAQVFDAVVALEAGADVLLPRSFSADMLKARVQSLLRRREVPPLPALVCGDYHFDQRARVLLLRGVRVELRVREYDLALCFFKNLETTLSRELLIRAVWPKALSLTSRTLDNHICRLRTRLQLCPPNGYVLDTIHRSGYRLAPAAAARHALEGLP